MLVLLFAKILDSWRSKRLLDPTVVDDVVQTLDRRKESLHLNPLLADKSELQASSISKEDILKRFEEDRERVESPFLISSSSLPDLFRHGSINF